MMATLTQDELEAIMAERQPRCISILMPVSLGGPEMQQNPIRFRRSLEQAEHELCAAGLRRAEARDRLAEARKLLDDSGVWREHGESVAAFIDGSRVRMYHLPARAPQLVYIGPRYHTRHVLPIFLGETRYFLLALSHDTVKLYEASRWKIEERRLPRETPRSFAEATRFDEPQKQLQWHTRAQPVGTASLRAAVFHGHGAGTDERAEKKRIAEFCHMVAAGIERVLASETSPLIIAAAEPIASIYREANRYRYLLDEYLAGNPDGLTPPELRQGTWPLIEPIVAQAIRGTVARYEWAHGAGLASNDLREVLIAAHNGQVQNLLVSEDDFRWGRFDAAGRELIEHDERQPNDDDLLDLAVNQAFRSGADVIPLPREQMPERALIAAIFRYGPVV